MMAEADLSGVQYVGDWGSLAISPVGAVPDFARAAVAVLVTFGVGLVVGGIAAVRRFRETGTPRADVDTTSLVPVG